MFRTFLLAAALVLGGSQAHAQTKDEWIELGTRIHGGFGVLIPIGIRIGLDALERMKTEPRSLVVTYYTGAKSPCPCIADGIILGARVSPGQSTLLIAPQPAPEGVYAMIEVRNRKTGEGLRYTVEQAMAPKIMEWNKTLDPSGRYDVIMGAEGLFKVEPLPKAN